jgi:predicted nucleic acid-binding protein
LNLYVESSAVLSWLFDEPRGGEVREVLATAELVVTSCLTLVECDRVLLRATAASVGSEAALTQRRGVLARTTEHWIVFDIDADVVARARRSFPAEPIRTLDAIHLASVSVVSTMVPDLSILSLDDRVRRAAVEMGFPVLPPNHA